MYLGRLLILLGLALLIVGGSIYLFARLGVNLGRLPGDFRIQTESVTCLIPLASSIILSIVLTVVLNLIIRFLNH
ncbi:MAG TPA: DUF2905 domain-containing protein [Anaerolineales bacterium]|nr:DUF2905 domain-containing protein [Anaerolineales bacterium]